MKQKLSLTLGIIVLVMMGLATSPAKAGNPTLQSILDALGTLQNSVNNMPPAWYQILPSDQRFLLVMGGVAVLDRETGLVWQQSPSTSTFDWNTAQEHCDSLIVGNRMGWRLPTVRELASLVDPSVPLYGLSLQSGHPFSNNVDRLQAYWSATTYPAVTSDAWAVQFMGWYYVGYASKAYPYHAWCARGGQGVDPQ